MITKREIAAVHVYAGLAGLNRAEYLAILQRAAGVKTSKALNQDKFERVMAALEAALWYRVAEGIVADPRLQPGNSGMRTHYWRDRLPDRGTCNSRLRWQLEQTWTKLVLMLPPEDRHEGYLAAIIAHAGAIPTDGWLQAGAIVWDRVPYRAAYLAVNALNDRLHHAALHPC